MYVVGAKKGEYTRIPESVLHTPTGGKSINDPTNPRNIAIGKWIEKVNAPPEKPIIGQHGKSEFEYHMRAGSEVKTEKIGYYKDAGRIIVVERVTPTGKISPKYQPAAAPTTKSKISFDFLKSDKYSYPVSSRSPSKYLSSLRSPMESRFPSIYRSTTYKSITPSSKYKSSRSGISSKISSSISKSIASSIKSTADSSRTGSSISTSTEKSTSSRSGSSSVSSSRSGSSISGSSRSGSTSRSTSRSTISTESDISKYITTLKLGGLPGAGAAGDDARPKIRYKRRKMKAPIRTGTEILSGKNMPVFNWNLGGIESLRLSNKKFNIKGRK
jgi:hypothetical protein